MSAPESVTITVPSYPSDNGLGWVHVVEELRRAARHEAPTDCIRELADQIEAQLPKPRPDEPTEWGERAIATVIEDGETIDIRLTRICEGTGHDKPWVSENGVRYDWSEFDERYSIEVVR